MPCSDELLTDKHIEHIQVELQTHNHSNEKEESHVDLCSPFCSCSCCGISVLNPVENEFIVANLTIKDRSKKIQKNFFQDEKLHNIWDPPKHS